MLCRIGVKPVICKYNSTSHIQCIPSLYGYGYDTRLPVVIQWIKELQQYTQSDETDFKLTESSPDKSLQDAKRDIELIAVRLKFRAEKDNANE